MQTQPVDLLSVIQGGGASSGASNEASSAAAGEFLNLLKGMQANGIDLQSLGINPKNPNVAELLTTLEQNPESVNPEILNLIKNINPEQEAAIDAVLKQSSGKISSGEVFFDGEKFLDSTGLKVDPKKLAKLKSINPIDISKTNVNSKGKTALQGSGDDFLSNLKAMQGQQNSAALTSGKNSVLKQYQNDQSKLGNNLVKSMGGNSKLDSTVDSIHGTRSSNVMDFMPEMTGVVGVAGSGEEGALEFGKGSTVTKVIDLSNISAGNRAELMTKISNYIEHNNIANGDSLEVLVKHDKIGDFKIQATKAEVGNAIELEIMTGTKTGQKFFMNHEVELVKALNNSGIKLSGVKVVASTELSASNADKNSSSDSFGSQKGSEQGFGQKGGHARQEDADSQRRRELWENYRDQAA